MTSQSSSSERPVIGTGRWRANPSGMIIRGVALAIGILCIGSLPVPAAAGGNVVVWGLGDSGQTNVPSSLGGYGEVAALAGGRYHCIALKTDGTVVPWGGGWGADTNWIPEGLNNVKAIAAGYDHNLALEANGTVAAWGLDNYLQCAIVDGMSNVTAIAAGNYNSVVMQSDGTVVGRGQYINYTTNAYTGNSVEVVALASGVSQDFGLRADGTLVDFRGGYVPDGLTGIKAIAAGTSHGVALQSNGTVVVWNSSTPVPEGLSNVVAIAAKGYRTMALKSDGTVEAWGWEYYGENTVPEGLSNVVEIAAGFYHSLALGDYSVAGIPSLQITNSASDVILSWAPESPGFVLQQAVGLSTNTIWSDAPSGSTNPVTIPAALPETYYRLYKP